MALPPRVQAVIDRFVAVCRDNPRIVAASLCGSHACGVADAHSDLDLNVISTNAEQEAILAELKSSREIHAIRDYSLVSGVRMLG